MLLETHRNGTLNDLFYTLEVLEMVPELRLCADLSHFVVDRELQLPLGETDQGYFATILERSDSFQGRISSNQQIQIALDFPQHRDWVMQYRQWWSQGIEGWARRQQADATLNFLVELGPPLTPLPARINASYPTAGWRAYKSESGWRRSGQIPGNGIA
ncbi:MAG: hypothetical protein CM15mP74_05870 [Halieaceae bacterium]|nr:MAG: hypothetical protein CM15mP74_05870 [Halieaceae bacterium]